VPAHTLSGRSPASSTAATQRDGAPQVAGARGRRAHAPAAASAVAGAAAPPAGGGRGAATGAVLRGPMIPDSRASRIAARTRSRGRVQYSPLRGAPSARSFSASAFSRNRAHALSRRQAQPAVKWARLLS